MIIEITSKYKIFLGIVLLICIGWLLSIIPTTSNYNGNTQVATEQTQNENINHLKIKELLNVVIDCEFIRPGDTITISVFSDTAERLVNVKLNSAIFGSKEMEENNGVYTYKFSVPDTYSGEMKFIASGITGEGKLVLSNYATVIVQPELDKLVSLKVNGGPSFRYSEGDNFFLYVEGKLKNGKVYDLSAASMGTQYIVSDPSIISIDQNGYCKALKKGKTNVLVKNNTFEELILINIDSYTINNIKYDSIE